ncbi:SusC/RagA family TonB-linked outer membrane protein [Halosquirtibacter laminarini]|uniref:SusC/RagA family TonB-linked outer membrane protein n=1 Tax=Halosquirtibacter laminarini TaxID=3374600 RepID=A0AC61NMB7_9BACT|nr:SusC/RagA family TonB-linked outer membrane protein [Prolixibacteraceae bacterium]
MNTQKKCLFSRIGFLAKGILVWLCLGFSLSVFAQTKIIAEGQVVGEDQVSIPGASVVVKGTTMGTITDFDGHFQIKVSKGDILQISYVGMVTREVVVDGSKSYQIVLKSDIQKVDEVVVTALGIRKEKKSLGYSVQDLGGDDLNKGDSNPMSSLSGKVSGVQVNNSASGEGGSVRVTIRGSSSIAGNNQPLYVVDGVPLDNRSLGGDDLWGGKDYGNTAADINPDNIESMSVLKGPTAAALYGSRAANGVILITTKKGKSGQVKVSYNGKFTFNTIAKENEDRLQYDYVQGNNGVFYTGAGNNSNAYTSWGSKNIGQELVLPDGSKYSANQSKSRYGDFYETGHEFVNSVNISGGTEKVQSTLGMTYTDMNSITPNVTLDKYNVSLRTTFDLSDKFDLDTKINMMYNNDQNKTDFGSSAANPVKGLIYTPSSLPNSMMQGYVTPDHSYHYFNENTIFLNPYWLTENLMSTAEKTRTLGMAKFSYKANDWLSMFVRTGVDYYSRNTSESKYANPTFQSGRYSEGSSRSFDMNNDFLITAQKDFNEDWSASLSAGGNMYYHYYDRTDVTANSLTVPGWFSVTNTPNPETKWSHDEKRINSLYAFGQLSYGHFIYLDITARNDWSSTLPSNNRSYFYPSASLGWVWSDMLTRMDVSLPEWLTYGKLRGSVAKVGNDAPAYLTNSTYTLQPGVDGNQFGRVDPVKPADDLKPEQTTSYEIGAEFKLFDGRLSLDYTYYKNSTKDQILVIDDVPSSGYKQRVVNAGEIQNYGHELSISAEVFRNENGFNWTSSLNASKNTNYVVSLNEDLNYYSVMANSNIIPANIRITAGGGYGDIYGRGYQRDGDGNVLVDDHGLPLLTTDYVNLGNNQPDVLLGWGNSFRYKKWTLDFMFNMSFGGEVYSWTNSVLAGNGNGSFTTDYREGGMVVEGVNATTGEKNTTSVTAQEYWQAVGGENGAVEPFLYDASYISLSNLSLSYRIGDIGNDQFSLKNVVVGVYGSNLWYVYKNTDGWVPNSSSSNFDSVQGIEAFSQPYTRSLGFNVGFNF